MAQGLRGALSGIVQSPCVGNRPHSPQPLARVRAGPSLTPTSLTPPPFLPLPPYPPFPLFLRGRVEIGRGGTSAGSMLTQLLPKYAKVENGRA
jgi:hypothetical protein